MHEARALLTPEGLEGVVATVTDNNPGMDESTAERVVAEALKFVHAAAEFPAVRLAPSKVVDEGWHALILHTKLYADLCEGLGQFVHHYPERPNPERYDEHVLTRTVATIEQAGYAVDMDLWTGPTKSLVSVAAQCQHTGCSSGSGCGTVRPGNCATHGGGEE
ncbi:glycine-rich domain-containing protein [Streptomyces californicus]|uniref:glycine-rich domain-containing protein n=1 Tax=Streptomyces californicus TaxID=67351 RepID=UPI003404F287